MEQPTAQHERLLCDTWCQEVRGGQGTFGGIGGVRLEGPVPPPTALLCPSRPTSGFWRRCGRCPPRASATYGALPGPWWRVGGSSGPPPLASDTPAPLGPQPPILDLPVSSWTPQTHSQSPQLEPGPPQVDPKITPLSPSPNPITFPSPNSLYCLNPAPPGQDTSNPPLFWGAAQLCSPLGGQEH